MSRRGCQGNLIHAAGMDVVHPVSTFPPQPLLTTVSGGRGGRMAFWLEPLSSQVRPSGVAMFIVFVGIPLSLLVFRRLVVLVGMDSFLCKTSRF